ncbi:MAG: pyridoxal 5'-phosphate synthase glutaminase subunit PdxT [Acidobacteria bacterium]|nr:MAG: pyridoxal 5'-phosphate synthase glutaminase subunit PdxT [Acidobacteriota bacterium]
MVIGILALQGGFQAHRKTLDALGVATVEVRLLSDLHHLNGLILPGGESSTMLKLLEREDLFAEIGQLGKNGLPILGTCAGAILMCGKVIGSGQKSFGFIPAAIERNAYGCQRESFETSFPISAWGLDQVHALFIRAPRFTELHKEVAVLSTLGEDVTGIQYKNYTAVTYHPELTADVSFHRAWLKQNRILEEDR